MSLEHTKSNLSSNMELFCRLLFVLAFLVFRNVRLEPQVPCLYAFRDSLIDNGNNNDLITLSRADYWPYGIDFPGGATSRFTHGRTTVDVLSI